MPSIETNRRLLEKVINNPAPESPKIPTFPSPEFPNTPNAWQRGPLPPPMVQSTDQQRGWQIGTVPTVRVSPLPPASNPQIGAAAASQALVIPSSSGTPNVSITLDMPQEFNVAGSPADATGTFDV